MRRKQFRKRSSEATMLKISVEVLLAFNNAFHFIALNGYALPEGHALSLAFLDNPTDDLTNAIAQGEAELQDIIRYIVMVQEGVFEKYYFKTYSDFLRTKITPAFFQRRIDKLPALLEQYLNDRADFMRYRN